MPKKNIRILWWPLLLALASPGCKSEESVPDTPIVEEKDPTEVACEFLKRLATHREALAEGPLDEKTLDALEAEAKAIYVLKESPGDTDIVSGYDYASSAGGASDKPATCEGLKAGASRQERRFHSIVGAATGQGMGMGMGGMGPGGGSRSVRDWLFASSFAAAKVNVLREASYLAALPEPSRQLLEMADRNKWNQVQDALAAGADPNVKDFYDRTPILQAMDRDEIGVVEALVNAGADVNATGYGGVTLLMMACKSSAATRGLTKLIRLLVKKGASTNAKDEDGKTAHDYAVATKQSKKVLRLLVPK